LLNPPKNYFPDKKIKKKSEKRTFGVGKYKAPATYYYYVQMTEVLSK
jgi:hypothetical protein